MKRKETIQTVYGDVEVSLVECASCGSRIREEDAHDFTLDEREGHACEFCVREGPAGYPTWKMETLTRGENISMVIFGPLILGIMTLIHICSDDETEYEHREYQNHLTSFVSGALYASVGGVGYMTFSGGLP